MLGRLFQAHRLREEFPQITQVWRDLNVLTRLAEGAGLDTAAFLEAVCAKAYVADITHVPTFLFRGERCAEAPYATIRELAERYLVWYDR